MEFTNKVAGNGIIFVGAGNVALLGDNTAFKGKINVESGAVATVSDQKNLGSAGLSVDGKLQLNSTSDWLFSHQISGSGILGIDTEITLSLLKIVQRPLGSLVLWHYKIRHSTCREPTPMLLQKQG